MFWVRIRLGGREYLGVLDTGATISIVAKKILPCGSLKNTMTTAAIRMGDGHVVHSCGDCEVEVPMGSRTIAHRFYVMVKDIWGEGAASKLPLGMHTSNPQTHEGEVFHLHSRLSKGFCDPCLGHDTIWRPGQGDEGICRQSKYVDK